MSYSAQPRTFAPGPPPFPLIEWQVPFVAFLRDPVAFMSDLHRRYGAIAASRSGNPWWIFAFQPQYNRQILSNAALFHSVAIAPNETPADSSLDRLTRNLLSMNGDLHRQQRRLMLPAFHRQRVETYHQQMVAITEQTIAHWQPGEVFDLSRAMQQLTMRIAVQTLFGVASNAEREQLGELISGWLHLLESGGARLLVKDWPGTPFRRLLRRSAEIEQRVREIIALRRANPTNSDVLSMLLAAYDEEGGKLSDTELVGQATLVFIAGHETSSNALTWTLFLLAQHPQIAADLLDELSVLGGAAPSLEQLNQLPLLDAVVKESLRLLPPAPYQMRYTTADTQIGPYDIPAGATITVSSYITHRLPEIYSEPQRFNPRRWEALDPGTYAYMPFGAGPHMCLGSTFALLEIRLALAMILQRYRLALQPNAQIDRRIAITMSPRYGMPMRIHRQDRNVAQSKAPVRGNIHQMVTLS